MPEERLQKILATAGVASRRKAEEFILAGRVSVNGKTVTELGSKANLETDEVKVDGQRLKAPEHFVYYAFHKPKNVVTTVSDPERRETVMNYFKGIRERIYPVGRLDYGSEGLLLLTNDGNFANRISSPASHVPKTYLVKVNGNLSTEQEESFRHGIPIHGRRTSPARLRQIREGENPWYEVTLTEGRQNQIRIMFKHFGFLVEKLKRTKIGFLELNGLKPGAYRTLTRPEVERFQRVMAALEEKAPARKPPVKQSGTAPKVRFEQRKETEHSAPARRFPAKRTGPPHRKGNGRGPQTKRD
jgi:23S rRNA pseudouridine2605 synthase